MQTDLFGGDAARQRLAVERKAAAREAPAYRAGRTRRARNAEAAPGRSKLFDAYKEWDRLNPEFYPLFERFALQIARAGVKKTGVALVWERIRWQTMIDTSGDRFKVNNNHKAYYARRFMRDHPEHGELFRTRELGVDVPEDQL